LLKLKNYENLDTVIFEVLNFVNPNVLIGQFLEKKSQSLSLRIAHATEAGRRPLNEKEKSFAVNN